MASFQKDPSDRDPAIPIANRCFQGYVRSKRRVLLGVLRSRQILQIRLTPPGYLPQYFRNEDRTASSVLNGLRSAPAWSEIMSGPGSLCSTSRHPRPDADRFRYCVALATGNGFANCFRFSSIQLAARRSASAISSRLISLASFILSRRLISMT